MPVVAYGLAVHLVPALQPARAAIRTHDPDLARQLQRCATSIGVNLAEGSGRRGADRTHHCRIAYGTLREVRACLDTAVACGWLVADEPSRELASRRGAVTYGLVRQRPRRVATVVACSEHITR